MSLDAPLPEALDRLIPPDRAGLSCQDGVDGVRHACIRASGCDNECFVLLQPRIPMVQEHKDGMGR
jgi:hypothetical protein